MPDLIVKDGELVDAKTGLPAQPELSNERASMPTSEDFDLSAKLADNEKEEVEARHITLNRVLSEIEAILIREEITMDEWGGMLDAFQARDKMMVGKLTIKEIKERSNE